LENVSGHLTLGFADVLADLAEIWWDAEWGTYRASDVGAPHRRERIFIVAYATRGIGGKGQGRGVSESEGSTGLATYVGEFAAHTDNSRSTNKSFTRQSQKCSIESDFDIAAHTSGDGHGQQLHARGMANVEGQTTRSTQQRQRSRCESDAGSVDDVANADSASSETRTGRQGRRNARRLQPVERGGSIVADTKSERASKHDSGLREISAGSGDGSSTEWGKYAPAIARWEFVLERAAPAPTIERNDKRRLNPQFVEWMMGLPDGWVTGHGLSAAKELKMLGNGVVPQQAHAAIKQLLERITP
jgi:DNA (cytosine-5)-methyltransferase 1